MTWFKRIKWGFRRTKDTPKFLEITDESGDEQAAWWGTFSIEEEQSRYFKIGSLILCLDRYNNEWHIASYRNADLTTDLTKLRNKPPFKTFSAHTTNEISLNPTLPDRALISRLEHPFYIPADTSTLLYISSPVSIRIEAGKPATLLDEIPTEILSDTWFGKSTFTGELCYAGISYCSPCLEDLPRQTTRVVSPVLIINRSKKTLLLEELKVPLPYLSIYCNGDHHLWTEQLNVYQEYPTDIETVVMKGPPKSLKGLQLITPARIKTKRGLKGLFNSFMWK